MTLKDIYLVVAKNGSGLTQFNFVGDFLSIYCDEFKIFNHSNEPYVWDSSSISRVLTKDVFQSRKLIFPIGIKGFEERLNIVTTKTLEQHHEYINEKTLKNDLLKVLKDQHVDMTEGEETSFLLTKTLLIWFKRKYEEYIKKDEGIPLTGRQSLFAMIIEEVANQTPGSSESVKLDLPYTIEDKIRINDIRGSLKNEIVESFDTYYETIEQALDGLSQKDVSVKSKFLNKIRRHYQSFLGKSKINPDDKDVVRKHSGAAFKYCSDQIFEAVKNKSMENVYEEDLYDYAIALVTYAFYKCRILLKVDKEDAD